MNSDERKAVPAEADKQNATVSQTDGSDERVQNEEQQKLDKIEGRMNNGETGGATKQQGDEQ